MATARAEVELLILEQSTVGDGQKVEVGFPMNQLSPEKLMGWRWIGEPEWAAIMPKGLVDCRPSRGAERARGRAARTAAVKCIWSDCRTVVV